MNTDFPGQTQHTQIKTWGPLWAVLHNCPSRFHHLWPGSEALGTLRMTRATASVWMTQLKSAKLTCDTALPFFADYRTDSRIHKNRVLHPASDSCCYMEHVSLKNNHLCSSQEGCFPPRGGAVLRIKFFTEMSTVAPSGWIRLQGPFCGWGDLKTAPKRLSCRTVIL